MTIRTRVRNLEAKAKPQLDLVTVLLAGRAKPREPMTQADVDMLAKTKLGRKILAARQRVGMSPPQLKDPA